jgi:hypothetical protein
MRVPAAEQRGIELFYPYTRPTFGTGQGTLSGL